MISLVGPFSVTVDEYPSTTGILETGSVTGIIMEIATDIDFDTGSAMDILVQTKGVSSKQKNILDVSGQSEGAFFSPRAELNEVDGTVIADQYTSGVVVYDQLVITITGEPGDTLNISFVVLN